MSDSPAPPAAGHVYARGLPMGARSSLSELARYVPAGSRVLDVGTGTGTLAALLQQVGGCIIDGVTGSGAEAQQARAHYRHLVVMDLDTQALADHVPADPYDRIVLADVLEHLRRPDRVLAACQGLLAPDGLLLVSVPNAAYAGMVAALMHGDLRLGDEGLLDRTHLHFFTRSTFGQVLQEQGWEALRVDTIEQPWFETEFHRPFDSLPPAVARHLLAQPDASAYQLLFVAARKGQAATLPPLHSGRRTAVASYVSQLFFDTGEGFRADRMVSTLAEVGAVRQVLRFAWPAGGTPAQRLRWDPADRAGYLHLRALVLRDARQQPLWQWHADAAGVQALAAAPRHQLELADRSPDGVLTLLLAGDDPQIVLPVPAAALAAAPTALEVTCDWPLSADYLAAVRDRQAPRHDDVPAPAPASVEPAQADSPAPARTPWWSAWRSRRPDAPTAAHAATAPVPAQGVDPVVEVVVPVYGNLALVQRCIASVLAASPSQPWHLTVINDGSPQQEVGAWLRSFAQAHPEATVLENARNQGFVRTVNLGMRVAGRRDVVLLNSDTEVAGDWLDRLRRAAWSAPQVASVTPFSNNATICSWPRFCEDNPLPPGQSTASLHALFSGTHRDQAVPIPTAVGFCMYMRRDAIDAVGEFDADSFGLGYGEENDWCMRATAAGWTHLHALDAFVYHAGGASFSERRHALQQQAARVLLGLHPSYDDVVRAYVQRDPARPYREAIDRLLAGGGSAAPAQRE